MAMQISSLVQDYGYVAVFIGTFLEGETILIIAGFAAHRGYLSLPLIMAVAAISSFLVDQLYFGLGRRYGPVILNRFPTFRPRAERVQTLLNRYDRLLILTIHFLYGLRALGPMAVGMSEVSWQRFLPLSLIGAVLWAILISGVGYAFGNLLELLLQDLRGFEEWILVAIAVLGATWWWLHRSRQWLLPWEK